MGLGSFEGIFKAKEIDTGASRDSMKKMQEGCLPTPSVSDRNNSFEKTVYHLKEYFWVLLYHLTFVPATIIHPVFIPYIFSSPTHFEFFFSAQLKEE